ncbi:type II secretion system minor pseudopilin GspK [Rahnella sp. C60]|uniref:type II secretion system minor pseudopilin GspK n=1 Tax=Rahnella perminowiae TaxID=2816244 RepID=UPI001C25C52F|nr:type II secretion system minor pseudopilin GspK [Rahnella perminowiae]MBU9813851.1 type II secretion system minor pseudopilin GspK [Rahnella perminowiae]
MSKQQGVALLIVLMILAIMAALAAKMTLQFQVSHQRQSWLLNQQQLRWLTFAAEEIALPQLRNEMIENPTRNSLDLFAVQQGNFTGQDGFSVDYIIADGQNCFNLNSLRNNAPDTKSEDEPYNTQVLKQLLLNAQATSVETERFVDTLSDYLDADNEARTSGAESGYYETLAMPRAAANQRLFSLNELALLPDLPRLPLNQIRQQLCILPEESQQININTLTEEQAPLLSALFMGGINQEDAMALISARPRRGWVSVDAFLKEAKKQRFTLEIQSSQLKPLLTVRSQYFVLYTLGRFEEQQNAMTSFVQFNPKDSKITIYQRRYRVIE